MTKGAPSARLEGANDAGGLRIHGERPSGFGAAPASGRAFEGANAAGLSGSIEVDRSEMLRYLGYAGQDIRGGLSERIEEAATLCESVSEPRYMWRAFSLATEGDAGGMPFLRLEGSTLELSGADISAHLEGASGCVIMAVTLGLSNEREARRLAVADPVLAMLFGAAGSALVETAADACCADIGECAAELGLVAGSRFSPGYGDLPLSVQPGIVCALGADRRMGMIPQDSGMVIPVKSVTAIAGVFEAPRFDGRAMCDACALRGRCARREAGKTCFR